MNRLKRAEKDRDELTSSKEGAENFMTREKEIRKRQNVLYQVHESTSMDNARQYADRRDSAKLQLEHERSKMKEGKDKQTALDVAYQAKKATYDAASKELNLVNSVSACLHSMTCVFLISDDS